MRPVSRTPRRGAIGRVKDDGRSPRWKLASPRTRQRERAKVAEAVEVILGETGTEGEIEVTIAELTEKTFLCQDTSATRERGSLGSGNAVC
jgi:hypothetical protein